MAILAWNPRATHTEEDLHITRVTARAGICRPEYCLLTERDLISEPAAQTGSRGYRRSVCGAFRVSKRNWLVEWLRKLGVPGGTTVENLTWTLLSTHWRGKNVYVRKTIVFTCSRQYFCVHFSRGGCLQEVVAPTCLTVIITASYFYKLARSEKLKGVASNKYRTNQEHKTNGVSTRWDKLLLRVCAVFRSATQTLQRCASTFPWEWWFSICRLLHMANSTSLYIAQI